MFGAMFYNSPKYDSVYNIHVITPNLTPELRVLGLIVEKSGDFYIVSLVNDFNQSTHIIGMFIDGYGVFHKNTKTTAHADELELVEPFVNALIVNGFSVEILEKYSSAIRQATYVDAGFGTCVVSIYHIHNMSLINVSGYGITHCMTNDGHKYEINWAPDLCVDSVRNVVEDLVNNVDFRITNTDELKMLGYTR